ncbi:MAG: hypothetical protein OIF32_10075 [Campylobacterales bacterium]|nr:hypothetical protein [Campylobacterales bacterium]
MSSSATLVKEIELEHTSKGVISVSHLPEPYGAGSDSVVSIGINLKGEAGQPQWKAHIPYDNVDAVIEALKEAKEKYSK